MNPTENYNKQIDNYIAILNHDIDSINDNKKEIEHLHKENELKEERIRLNKSAIYLAEREREEANKSL